MFILNKFRDTTIAKTNKTHQKVIATKFVFKMSTIHTNTCAQTTSQHAVTAAMMEWSSTSSLQSLSRGSFNSFTVHIMDLQLIDLLLKNTLDAVVHRIQMRRIGWPHLWGDELWHFSLWQHDSCTSRAQCDFIDVNITSPGKGCTCYIT